ncbi:TlpA family protein disulfide reductase [Leptospira borgpetersenii]|uniref:Redoxin domain protein n=1 Tax=Leptospira borgpetersenii serovar Pomona str. 200901868 TaxID=1192866 RepID=M6WIN8_LEPBO|nr:TlpA disulfide reductase family protein [Leptospira borgpetersenii]EMO61623.1 redoxin domain protein [Leptospira borgpetersenii serovar Pomona str. 200901868]MBE8399817.1 TlpA family protein disulfide reductase [Leptospira borgpetersenii serovar Tarassovi]MBE8402968.1 TlpA family protein disulfide reductase [Leptospira borgpetersenii serovar Tarassovi]MBE8405694.1 TlpA family protein disulfide reductase [Leptospira borgpetersenii serovar Tarassovi]MBE8411820.1 TlpA family protein disulfide 
MNSEPHFRIISSFFLGSYIYLMNRILLCFVFCILTVHCTLSEQPNLGIHEFQGITLDGTLVRLSEVEAPRLVLNVYGPNCVPCIKEIPALNYLYQDMQKDPKIQFYMAVDPTLFFDEAETMSEEELLTKGIFLVKEEIRKYGIQVPTLLMKKPFRVSRTGSIVTGTPETLLFKTKPFVLYYNFIGPISEEENPQRLSVDQKVLFFKRMAGSS